MGFRCQQALQVLFLIGGRQLAPVMKLQWVVGLLADDLNRGFNPFPDERSSQHRMPFDYLLPGAIKVPDIKLAAYCETALATQQARLCRLRKVEEEILLYRRDAIYGIDILYIHLSTFMLGTRNKHTSAGKLKSVALLVAGFRMRDR